jgi:iron complex transport system substrate-binding protein
MLKIFILLKRPAVLCFLLLSAGVQQGCSERVEPPEGRSFRVVSMAPSITEIVCAVGGGDMLVGRTSACDYPAWVVEKVPVVGSFGNPSLEALMAVDPDLVLHADLADLAVADKMSQMGLRTEMVACNSVNGVPPAIRRAGNLIGCGSKAETLASRIEKKLEQLNRKTAAETGRPDVYVEIWDDPLWTTGRKSHLSTMVHLAGGRNIGDEVNKDHFQVAHEWVVAANPDVILCLYMSRKQEARHEVMKRPGWQSIDAVVDGDVYDGFDNNLILRPGPRVVKGIERLRERIDAAD